MREGAETTACPSQTGSPLASSGATRRCRRIGPSRQRSPTALGSGASSCKRIAYEGELAENLRICKHCGHHLALTAPERIELLADEGSFAETDAELVPCDPLEFVGRRPYVETLASAAEKSGLPEAVVTGTAKLDGRPVVLAAMDFRFIGASMGSVVGREGDPRVRARHRTAASPSSS